MRPVSELTPEERAALRYYEEYEPPEPVRHEPRFPLLRKLLGPLVAVGALLVKFGGVLLKGKFFFSIFISAAFYVWYGGWWFGIGLIVLLFVHEMGHVLEAKRQGLPVTAPLFIPFFGSAGALALWIAGEAADSNSLKAIAFLGFLINLFNLLPVVPLDGGRIVGALHPALWFVGFLALLGLVVVRPNPLLILILIFSGMELWNRWQTRNHPERQSYYRVRPSQRVTMAVLYFGLAILLVVGMHATHVPRDLFK